MKQFEDSGRDAQIFSAESANPIYATDPQYKKINELGPTDVENQIL